MKLGLPAAFIAVIFLCGMPARSQSAQEDSIFCQSALASSISFYYKQLGDQSQIYNGSLYTPLPYSFREGSPFFNEKPAMGSVQYDQIWFNGLSLLYDDYRQYLILDDQGFQLQLVNEKIRSFTIEGHHFENINPDSLHQGLPAAGFYEILYDGRSEVLKKTYKKPNENLSVSEGVTRVMDVTENYFIKRDHLFEPVNTKAEMLNRMKRHRKEIQRYLRKNKLNFRKDKDHTLMLTAAYFDQLAD